MCACVGVCGRVSVCAGTCGQLPLLRLCVLCCMTCAHKCNHLLIFMVRPQIPYICILVYIPPLAPQPSLAGTLLLLHSKPCWDTAPAPPLPPTSCKNEPCTWLLLLLSPGSYSVAQNPRPSYFFSNVIRVAHSSKRTFVLLFINHVGPLLYAQPRYFVYPSTPNLTISPFLRYFVQSSTCLFPFFGQLTNRGAHPPILTQRSFPIIQSVLFFVSV